MTNHSSKLINDQPIKSTYKSNQLIIIGISGSWVSLTVGLSTHHIWRLASLPEAPVILLMIILYCLKGEGQKRKKRAFFIRLPSWISLDSSNCQWIHQTATGFIKLPVDFQRKAAVKANSPALLHEARQGGKEAHILLLLQVQQHFLQHTHTPGVANTQKKTHAFNAK